MTRTSRAMARQAGLVAVAILSMAGCADDDPSASAQQHSSAATASALPTPSPSATSGHDEQLAALEQQFDARLGVYAVNTGTGATLVHQADDRFAFCSTFKGLAAAALLDRHPMSYLDTTVKYTSTDVLPSATEFTKQHTSMTMRQALTFALQNSDGTAGNLLLRELGGPPQLTAYLRTLDDTVTQAVRNEPSLTEASPGDVRDTTSPRAIGNDYRQILLGDALPADQRTLLVRLLMDNQTVAGRTRIKAGLPPGWTIADKTGTGSYGTTNDIAIVWPPNHAPPLVIAVMSAKKTQNAVGDDALLAQTAKYVIATLTR
jgi:beta-lactamase class A